MFRESVPPHIGQSLASNAPGQTMTVAAKTRKAPNPVTLLRNGISVQPPGATR
jgi:hypothetical protein